MGLNLLSSVEVKKLSGFASTHNIQFDLILEAGAHDGENTCELKKYFPRSKIIVIEPDQSWKPKLVKLLGMGSVLSIALSDRKGLVNLYSPFPDGSISGNLVASDSEIRNLKLTGTSETERLDSLHLMHFESGLLWLNIMGSTYPALKGVTNQLRNFKMIVVNFNFRTMYEGRLSNYFSTTNLMSKFYFLPIHIDLRRKNFGWGVFLHKDCLSKTERLKAMMLLGASLLLHFLYILLPANLD